MSNLKVAVMSNDRLLRRLRMALRETKFTIDTFGDRIFDGFTLGEDWNGWACPYFTFDQAQRVVEAHREHGGRASYEEGRDSFALSFSEENSDRIEDYPSVEIDGRKVHPVGAFNWIWEEGVHKGN